MKHTILRTVVLASVFAPMSVFGSVSVLPLTPDTANSSPSAFSGSQLKTLNDSFAYDPLNPTNPLPNQEFNQGQIGYHADLPQDVDALLSYTTNSTEITAEDSELVVDLYGRKNLDCCNDRDDNIDVFLYNGSYEIPLATVTGLFIDNTDQGWVRATFSLPIGTTFDRIRIIGHDSGGGAARNYFTLLEVRSALITPIIDEDNDGLPDDWEIANGLSPTDDGTIDPNNGPDGDPDSDNLTNLQAYQQKTDPQNPDTDGDGLLDGEEVTGAGNRPPTDPLKPDTDGDGLSDWAESNTGIFVDANDTGTNPLLADSDNDGTPDGEEVTRGTNPNNPNIGGNLALGKVGGYFNAIGDPVPAWGGLPATNVNDGVPATISHTLSQESVDYYYQLDLGADTSVTHVVVTGRGFRDTCCPERLENPTLVIINSSGTEVFRQEVVGQIIMSEEIDLSAAPPYGQFVRIVNTAANPYGPQLGEVAIFGSSSPPIPLRITDLQVNQSTGNVTLTWDSQPEVTYSVFGSRDLQEAVETSDSVSSQGSSTTYSFIDPEIQDALRYFYHVQKN